ncbi:ejaculatory bulb-specific protein 3-like [Vespa crabro]|uniref:ejaculatory bulb-specific protein 3-like n=1 Tax=Vespa crabro TaxID=7445 RepID=UPI001F0058F0|nr:ejaculatory bulb-specific protein 3-like [Vespa crabro]
MKFTYVYFLIIGICGLIVGYKEENYPNIYDQVDVDAIFNSERFLNQYINCLLDEGPCTADGRSLKQILPEILATQCARCNEYQKKIGNKLWQLKEKKPDVWNQFQTKYDPENIYFDKFEAYLKD